MAIAEKDVLSLFCLLFIAMYLFYYPLFYIEGDDQVYLRTAYRLIEGHGYSFERGEEVYAYSHLAYYNPIKDNYYFPFNPLTPIILIPFTILSFRLVFLAPLLFHLIGFYLFYRLLKELQIDTRGSILYLFFPAMMFLTRTLLSDMFIVPFLLASFLFYLKEKHLYASVILGVAYLIRGEALIFVLVYSLCLLWRTKYHSVAKTVLPFAAFFILLLFINYAEFGSVTNPDYGGKFIRGFVEGKNPNILQNVWNYVLALNIISVPNRPDNFFFMPLMFIPLLLYNKRGKMEIALLTVFLIVFHAILLEGGFLKYIIPLSLFLLIPYIDHLKRIQRYQKFFFAFIVVIMVFFALFLSIRYFTVSTIKYTPSYLLYTYIPPEYTVLASEDDGFFFYLHEGMGRLGYVPIDGNNTLKFQPPNMSRMAYVHLCPPTDGVNGTDNVDIAFLNETDLVGSLTLRPILCQSIVLNVTITNESTDWLFQ